MSSLAKRNIAWYDFNSQKGIIRVTSLSYLDERGSTFCACLQFDCCLVPFMDGPCLLTDLPQCCHLPNDTLLSMTSDRQFFLSSAAMYMYPHAKLSPTNVSRKICYCFTTRQGNAHVCIHRESAICKRSAESIAIPTSLVRPETKACDAPVVQ